MPISSSDLLFKYSTGVSGSSGNTASQSNPDASLGKFISTTQWLGGSLNDLFGDITGDENAAMQVDYRCIFLNNNNNSLTLLGPVLWVASEVMGGANIAIAVDPTPASSISSGSAQALSTSSATTVPTGSLTFSTPTTKNTGLALNDIPAGQCKAFWLRRTATNSAAINNDGFTIECSGDSSAAIIPWGLLLIAASLFSQLLVHLAG